MDHSNNNENNGIEFVLTVFLVFMAITLMVTAIFRSNDDVFISWVQVILSVASISLAVYTLNKQLKIEQRISKQRSFDMRMEILERFQKDLALENFHSNKVQGHHVFSYLRWYTAQLGSEEPVSTGKSCYLFQYLELTRFTGIYCEMVNWLLKQDEKFSKYFLTIYSTVNEDIEFLIKEFKNIEVENCRMDESALKNFRELDQAFSLVYNSIVSK